MRKIGPAGLFVIVALMGAKAVAPAAEAPAGAKAAKSGARHPIIWKLDLERDAAQWTATGADLHRTTAGLRLDVATSASALALSQAIDTDHYNMLEIKLSAGQTGQLNGHLQWRRGEKFNPRDCAQFSYLAGPELKLRVPLAQAPHWQGAIQGLRLHPADRPGAVTIQSVKLFYRPPGATTGPATIQWVDDINIRNVLKSGDRPVMVYVFRLGDPTSKRLADSAFRHPGFVRFTHRFHCIRLLAEDTNKYEKYIGDVYKTPTFIFLRRGAKPGEFEELERLVGYHTPDQFNGYTELIVKQLESDGKRRRP